MAKTVNDEGEIVKDKDLAGSKAYRYDDLVFSARLEESEERVFRSCK